MTRNVIIIGAPRSGTNMLRDTLTALPGIETWPCDEINYIWRHGNLRYPSDEFSASMARPEVVNYIRGQFDDMARATKAHTLVEKTCANSLRVDFVDRILGDARYIYIRRSGIDVVASAQIRWKAQLDLAYVFNKARFVPPSDLPYYALRYFWHRVHRLTSKDQRLGSWGPRLDEMDEILAKYSLLQVCAIQWQRCVEAADSAIDRLPSGQVLEVSYEEFVVKPIEQMTKILTFLGVEADQSLLLKATREISPDSVGKGMDLLGADTVAKILPYLGAPLVRHGYTPER